MSDDATTCHILALWSRGGGGAVLATMTHVDGPGYGASVREAFEEHVSFHSLASRQSSSQSQRPRPASDEGEESKESGSDDSIDMSVHIVGGFDDDEGSSVEITDSLLRTLAVLAGEDRRTHVRVTLATCAVAGGNGDRAGGPAGRGLGLTVSTGEAFLAEVEEPPPGADGTGGVAASAGGPAAALRGARLWAAALHGPRHRRLRVVHRPDGDRLRVEPFFFGPHKAVQDLLECADDELLDMASTSPSVEKATFVQQVRESLEYMNQTDSRRVFRDNRAVEYERVGLNGWMRV